MRGALVWVPEGCEDAVVDLLVAVRRREHPAAQQGDEDFDILQNAEVVAAAERYYRTIVRGDRGSWNLRDMHMADTVDRITAHLAQTRKGWSGRTTSTSATRAQPIWLLRGC
jgi:erythromycin esterase